MTSMMYSFPSEPTDPRESGAFVVVEPNENKLEERSGGWEGELYQRNSEPYFQEHNLTKGRMHHWEDKKENARAVSQRQNN